MAKPKSKYATGKNPNSLANLKKAWKPGESGNPKGRPPNIKYVSEALRERLARGELDAVTLADILADSLIKRAKKSDFALNIILERTEGKVTQPITPDGPIIFKVIYERVWDKTPGTTP